MGSSCDVGGITIADRGPKVFERDRSLAQKHPHDAGKDASPAETVEFESLLESGLTDQRLIQRAALWMGTRRGRSCVAESTSPPTH